ncbi:DUF1492 domain-containing protein [Enterococcus wangshanyuanii]|uniref:Uncharacterized protein n=1 Tax=Enterococcus wangshanyuanii TaxID=2005703 RepID=A0ABQ1NEU2_9ENTE|nr:DUF1492 domain-containing protein [Enterococcus wangshanyuanii]GGC74870.1 hypothetical protein GCM10011573_00510 [Enterococcus wangshanyuanii]
MKEENQVKKSYLKRYRRYQQKIKRLEEKLLEIDNRITGIKSVEIKDMPSGGQTVTIEDLFVQKEETKKRIKNLTDINKQNRLEIYHCIDQLEDDRSAEVLECFFIDSMTFEEIADMKHYSVRHIVSLYAQGLDNVKLPIS